MGRRQGHGGKPLKPWAERYGLDLRSLALLRVGLAGVLLTDLGQRWPDLAAHYSDQGVLPRQLLSQLWQPGDWSLHALNGHPWFQGGLFAIATLCALAMLVGYRTRLATIAAWGLLISLHNRNPLVLFAADDVLRAVLFWAMFLPLGAAYSIDQALNTSPKPRPQRILTSATLALMAQQSFIYLCPTILKLTGREWWPDGTAAYYALSFDQYATPLGHTVLELGLAHLRWLLPLLTFIVLSIEGLGPLLLWSPMRTEACRRLAVVLFILLHLSAGLTLHLGLLPVVSSVTWLAFIPTAVWERWTQRTYGPQQRGLAIYYDADCGFCKKVVHLLRTFLVLPLQTPLKTAQSDPEIHAAMLAQNSWVIVDWQGRQHYKFEGIAYVVSLSPVLGPLARLLRWPPLMASGTRFYETIANNRQTAGRLTRPLKFKAFDLKFSPTLSLVTLTLLLFTSLWNLHNLLTAPAFNTRQAPTAQPHPVVQRLNELSQITRLDQAWQLFAPAPPRDDGWYVAVGQLADRTQVNLLQPSHPIQFKKPSLQERQQTYRRMPWRNFFINLNRNPGKLALSAYGRYLCRHGSGAALQQVELYWVSEPTAPPGQPQPLTPKRLIQQSCKTIP